MSSLKGGSRSSGRMGVYECGYVGRWVSVWLGYVGDLHGENGHGDAGTGTG